MGITVWNKSHSVRWSAYLVLGIAIVECGCQPAALEEESPQFGDYPVGEITTKELSMIDWDSHPRAREFSTQLEDAIGMKPNFAGHYVLLTWGCGSPCQAVVLVDVRSTSVYFTLGAALGVEFRLRSRLFIDSPPSNIAEFYGGEANVPNQRLFYSNYFLWDEEEKTFERIYTDDSR